MKIVVGSDHAGFALKQELAEWLRQSRHDVLDVGAHSSDPSDYPDFAEAVGRAVIERRAERGVLICGSGVGASVAACKLPGIRAAVCHDSYSAHQGVEHDDMNVLVLGSRVVGEALARDLVAAYLGARFSGEPRHVRRLAKIGAIEARYGRGAETAIAPAPGSTPPASKE
jgi:RpiB/LacA/LacB family sugar-phosphate isomerase